MSDIYTNDTYIINNPGWHSEDSSWKANQIQQLLIRNRVHAVSVCEVGCGAGQILKELSLKISGDIFSGYETSPQAYEICKTKKTKKVNFFKKNITEEAVFFDLLLCIDVFEHVPDYIGFIEKLKNKAIYKVFHIPLDITVLSVIRGSFIKSRYKVGHLHYFTFETAIATLEDAGYEVIDFFYTKSYECSKNKKIGLIIKALNFIRFLMFLISPHWGVRFLGGGSLIVLTK